MTSFTPATFSKGGSMHQKQPPANMAFSRRGMVLAPACAAMSDRITSTVMIIFRIIFLSFLSFPSVCFEDRAEERTRKSSSSQRLFFSSGALKGFQIGPRFFESLLHPFYGDLRSIVV